MASQPSERCRHFVRCADIPAKLRLQAASVAKIEWPDDGPELIAAALYPDPEHGEWVAEPLEDLLSREGLAA